MQLKLKLYICLHGTFLEFKNSLKWVLWEWGFICCLRFRRHFFRHMDFLRFNISKKIFFLNLDFRCISWFLVYPFLGIFLLKVQNGCVYVIMLKIALVLFQIYVFMGKKRYKQISAPDSCKTYCFSTIGIDHFGPLLVKNVYDNSNNKMHKAWVTLYTRALTRNIILDLIPSLSTNSLKNSLKRFISRRGCPENIILLRSRHKILQVI